MYLPTRLFQGIPLTIEIPYLKVVGNRQIDGEKNLDLVF